MLSPTPRRRTASFNFDESASANYHAMKDLEGGQAQPLYVRTSRTPSDPEEYSSTVKESPFRVQRNSKSSNKSWWTYIHLLVTLTFVCSTLFLLYRTQAGTAASVASFPRGELRHSSSGGEDVVGLADDQPVETLEDDYIPQLEAKAKALEDKVAKLESMAQKKEKAIGHLETQLEAHENQTGLEGLIHSLKEELDEQAHEVVTLKEEIETKDLEVVELKKKIDEMTKAAATAQEEHNNHSKPDQQESGALRVSSKKHKAKHDVAFYHKEILRRDREISFLKIQISTLQSQLQSVNAHHLVVEKKADDEGVTKKLRGGKRSAGSNDVATVPMDEFNRLVQHDHNLVVRIEQLKHGLQIASREVLRLRFGGGAHKVRVTVKFPPSMTSGTQSPQGDFVVQLADPALMPHTTLYWLSQIDSGIWKGSTFIRNAPHVLQADPQDMSGHFRREEFSEEKMPLHLSYQEYDDSFSHKRYTLGIPGRPGGPDWYINTEDNVQVHGPNGQLNYDFPEEADPCFGRVVEGFDVVDRMHAMPVRDHSIELVEHIEIVDTVILTEARLLESTDGDTNTAKLRNPSKKVETSSVHF